jgi:hypothetical protein
MFTPAAQTRGILNSIGILGQIPAPSFNVVLTHIEQGHVATGVIMLSRTLTRKNLDAFMDGSRTLIPKVLALNGKAGWISTIATLCHHIDTTSIRWRPAPHGCPRPADQNAIFLTCPNELCAKVETSTCRDFQFQDLDAKHKCFHCHRCIGIRKWYCPCGVRWHLCSDHSVQVGQVSISPRSQVQANWQSSSSGSRGTKRAASSRGYDELTAEDLRVEGKRGRPDHSRTITLGDAVLPSQAPTRLGLAMRRRLGM